MTEEDKASVEAQSTATTRLNFGAKASKAAVEAHENAEQNTADEQVDETVDATVEEASQDEAMAEEQEATGVQTVETDVDGDPIPHVEEPADLVSETTDENVTVETAVEDADEATDTPDEVADAKAEVEKLEAELGDDSPKADREIDPSKGYEPEVKPALSDEEKAELADTATVNKPTGAEESVEELKERQAVLAKQIEEKQAAEKKSVLTQIKTVIENYNITTEELVDFLGGYKVRRKGVKAKPKYRDPATGTTWSGRGKTPNWLVGKDETKFLITDDVKEEEAKPEAKAGTKKKA